MHPHHHRRIDKDHQWCLSLGDFTGGEFCWQERDQCFSMSTKDQWQKIDGRHMHWVLPHQPQNAIRYSIVLFRNRGDTAELFYHSDAVAPKLGDRGPPQRPFRVGHDCAGTNATCQALRNLPVAFTEAFASDIDKFVQWERSFASV